MPLAIVAVGLGACGRRAENGRGARAAVPIERGALGSSDEFGVVQRDGLDLRTDKRGRTVAVYARCRLGRDGDFAVPIGCRLSELDPRTGIETAPDLGGDPRADLMHPALHDGVVAYAEVLRGGPSRIAVKRLGSPRPPRTVKTLPITNPERSSGSEASGRTPASPSFAGGALYFAYTNRSAARLNQRPGAGAVPVSR